MTPAVLPSRAPWFSRWWAGVLLVAVLCALGWLGTHLAAHWIVHLTGQDNESGGHYGFWSGFGGSVPDILIITGFAGWYWRGSCHHSGCWMPGHHDAAGGCLRTCRWHHPQIRGRKITQEVIDELHHLHLRRTAGEQ
jgi:hypothetical protein